MCGKGYGTANELTCHKRLHTGIGLFTCNICGKVCTAKAQLSSHIQRFHIRGKPFKCDKCDDCFVTSNGLLNT